MEEFKKFSIKKSKIIDIEDSRRSRKKRIMLD